MVLAVAGEQEASSAAFHLRLRGYRDHPEGAVVEHKDGRLATIRLVSPPVEEGSGTEVDLLIASSGVEEEVVAGAELLEVLPRMFIPVAQAGHLLALKVLAGRMKDLIDVESLLKVIDEGQRRLARETLALIQERGFHRDKDLLTELEKLEQTFS